MSDLVEQRTDAALLRELVGPLVPRARMLGVAELLEADGRRLRALGLTPGARRRLRALAELARRHQPRARLAQPLIRPREALSLLGAVRTARTEVLAIVPLDARLAAIGGAVPVARGTVSHVSVEPREVFAPAIARGASGLLLAHNHPTGNVLPSVEDIEFTRTMMCAGETLGICVLDHLIVTRRGYVSLAEAGLMPDLDPSEAGRSS